MLYELRHYDACSGHNQDTLVHGFETTILPLWKRLGMESVGFWSVQIGPISPRLTCMLAWEDLGQRERLWDTFESDPEYRKTLVEAADGSKDPVRTVTNTILRPTPRSPLARHDNQPNRLSGGVFELRTLIVEDERSLRRLSDWFGEYGQAHLEKHGMFLMGLWETYIGIAPRLSYMLVLENMAHRERAWAAFYTDPTWADIQAGLYPDGTALIGQTESCLMKGTEFSHWR